MKVNYRISVEFKRRNSENWETKEIAGCGFRHENLDTVVFDERGQELDRFSPDRYENWIAEAEHSVEL